ncbi:MAG: mechanosensitive ion channel family protein [Candidatus Pacebacteria bacterium]|nr:mechanosensitive ion channel family protein [Candidatus Paceibacterota bacterium]
MIFNLDFIKQEVVSTIFAHGMRIVGILIISYLVHHFSGRIITRVIMQFARKHDGTRYSEEKREKTLIQVINKTLGVFIYIVAVLMILSELGVAIGPLLAAAGIAGVAIGFGSQYLIRDIISGLLIIIENQYRVGDVVCFDKTCGLVETVTLRMTTLRDLNGTVHHVPHGEVKKVSNLSKDFARVNIDIGVSYSSNLDHVIDVINKVGNTLALDEEWKDKILTAPQFLRVDDFADSSITIKILGETKALEQWAVAGEFRKRIKIAFDNEGIKIPFPQRVVHSKEV